jgi:hypothetical protein
VTTYQSPIHFGVKYRDDRTGIEGHAVALAFQENGCVEVLLERGVGEPGKEESKLDWMNELRLVAVSELERSSNKLNYESDIELSKKYRDTQSGLEGWACIVEFHEHMANRTVLRHTGVDKDGTTVIKNTSIDDFLLEDVETKKVARRTTAKRSPVTREVTPRR